MLNFLFGHECQICKNKTKEYLIDVSGGGEEKTWLCRTHLISEFKKYFLAYPSKMVICQPDDGWNSYSFYDLKNFMEYGDVSSGPDVHIKFDRFTKEGKNSLTSIIGDLSDKKCQGCFQNAEVVYLSEKHWNEKCDVEKKYYCKLHGFETIENSLINNNKQYTSGIYLPNNGEGLYISEWI